MKQLIALVCLVAGCAAHEENLGYLSIGTPRWAVTFGGPNNDEGKATAVDSIGDVVVAGTLDISYTDAWAARGFVTKRVASDGAERWTRTFTSIGAHSTSQVTDVAIGAQDTVIAAGYFSGTVDFGGQTRATPTEQSSMFLAAYSTMGHLLWVNALDADSVATALTVDGAGQIYVAGQFVSTSLDMGGTIYTERAGDADAFLAAYDAQGTLVWGTAFQATSTPDKPSGGPTATGLAIASNGDVLLTGLLLAPTSLGGAVHDPQASSAVYLTRFRSDGLYLASQRFGRKGAVAAWNAGVAVDAAGHIVLQHAERDDNQPRTLTPNILRVLDDDGQELWSASIDNGGTLGPQFRTLTTTPDGLIVTSAWTDNPVAPDEGSMEVVAYDAVGQAGTDAFGARVVHAPVQTLSNDTAVDAAGGLAYTGAFAGELDFGTDGGPAVTSGKDDSDVFIVALDRPSLVGQP